MQLTQFFGQTTTLCRHTLFCLEQVTQTSARWQTLQAAHLLLGQDLMLHYLGESSVVGVIGHGHTLQLLLLLALQLQQSRHCLCSQQCLLLAVGGLLGLRHITKCGGCHVGPYRSQGLGFQAGGGRHEHGTPTTAGPPLFCGILPASQQPTPHSSTALCGPAFLSAGKGSGIWAIHRDTPLELRAAEQA